MLTSPAVFPNLCSSCLMRSRSSPNSSACCRIKVSFSLIIFSKYVGVGS
nr:MAG TPA: hypothetical protein [Caudoviricetes sp.]